MLNNLKYYTHDFATVQITRYINNICTVCKILTWQKSKINKAEDTWKTSENILGHTTYSGANTSGDWKDNGPKGNEICISFYYLVTKINGVYSVCISFCVKCKLLGEILFCFDHDKVVRISRYINFFGYTLWCSVWVIYKFLIYQKDIEWHSLS